MRPENSSGIVRLPAALTWRQAEARTAAEGCTLGLIPAWLAARTVLETVALNDRRRPSPAHGELLDAIIAIEATLPDGTRTHSTVAPRRAMGPDLARSVVGAQGRAGAVTAVLLQAWPVPRQRAWRARSYPDWCQALDAGRGLLAAGVRPLWWRWAQQGDVVELFAGFGSTLHIETELAAFDQLAGGRPLSARQPEAFEQEVFSGRTTERHALASASPSGLAALAEAHGEAEVWDLRSEGGTVWQRRAVHPLVVDPAWAELEATFIKHLGAP
jgi:FAD/FMN-containing dehydrogenase